MVNEAFHGKRKHRQKCTSRLRHSKEDISLYTLVQKHRIFLWSQYVFVQKQVWSKWEIRVLTCFAHPIVINSH